MNHLHVCCFGIRKSFDYNNIGGTDSYFRRIAVSLVDRGCHLSFVLYGFDDESVEEPYPGLIVYRFKGFHDALAKIAEFSGVVLVSAVSRRDRWQLIKFRKKCRAKLRFYFIASVFYERWLRRIMYFFEARLLPYNGGVFSMSPRLVCCAERNGNQSTLLLPPVPEEYFVMPVESNSEKKIVVTYMGRSIEGKGADEALEIFKLLEDDERIEARFCGYIWPDEREDSSIHNYLIKQKRINYICEEYEAWSPSIDEKVARALKETDILILPYKLLSSTIDMPLLLLEGMAANCVIITKDMGDLKEIYGTDRFMPPAENFVPEVVDLIKKADEYLDEEKKRVYARTLELAFNTEAIVDSFLDTIGERSQQNEAIDRSSAMFLRRLFLELEKADVAYCVLRNYENLPEDYGNDLDIFITKADFVRGLQIIENVARMFCWSLLVETSPMGNKKLYWKPCSHLEKILIMDVFRGIYWKGIPAIRAEDVIDHRMKFNDLHVARGGVEGAITIMKELLMFGVVKKRRNARDRIQWCAKSDHEGFSAALRGCYGKKRAEWITGCAEEADWQGIEKHYRGLRVMLAVRLFMSNPVLQMARWLRFIVDHIVHWMRKPVGLFVVLIGPDGAGKTTMAEKMASFWDENIHADVVMIHGDFKIMPRLRWIRVVWARVKGAAPKEDVDFTKRHSGSSVKPYSLLRSFCSLLYYSTDYILGGLAVARNKYRDRLIIADRYFYDYYFQPANSRLPFWLLDIFRFFVPRPDLVLYLERDAEDIYAKKNELSIEGIHIQQERIQKLIKRCGGIITINGDNGIDMSEELVRAMILETIGKK